MKMEKFFTKKEILDNLFRLLIVVFSNLLLSVATVWFLEPANLYSGGATGTAQLVQKLITLSSNLIQAF